MRLSLHEVLAIVGRLDDTPGYDTPRKRFRQFLLEHMTSPPVARTFLDEAQQLISEQYQRALQDTVLATGGLLGFETEFHGYERHGLAARTAGEWVSRRRLAVTVQVWCDGAAVDPAVLDRTLDAPLLHAEGVAQVSRLCVVAPAFTSRHRLEERLSNRPEPTRIVSIRGLMDLLALAGATHLSHDDIVRLLAPAPPLEASIALLTRLAHASREGPDAAGGSGIDTARADHAHWMYVVRERDGGPPAPGYPDVLRVTSPVGEPPAVVAGAHVAFLVPSRGIVATARVADIQPDGNAADPAFTTFLLTLREIAIADPALAVDTEQRLNLELQAAVSHEPYVRVSRREFEELTAGIAAAAEVPAEAAVSPGAG